MESFFATLLGPILAQGNPGVMALLLLVAGSIGFLSFKRDKEYKKERSEMIEKFQKQIESDRSDLLEVIDKYQEGQMSVVQAMNEIRILIATIGAKL
jgi:NAD kinase